MTDTSREHLVDAARTRAAQYRGCTGEQALTYACEDVVDDEMPTRTLDFAEAARVVDDVCDDEDLDPPRLERGRARRAVASADLESYALCVHRPRVSMLTIMHELAHLSTHADSHGVLFRDELVRLVRAHIGVEHAAVLHGLFAGCGLEVSPWGASGRRPDLHR